jgi:hypothetical protein
MFVRVRKARTAEADAAIVAQPIVCRIQRGVLASENQRRFQPARGERMSDWSQFDCFWPGANHQPDVGETQPSP